MLALCALTAAAAILIWRRTGPPGELAVFKGTKWTVVPYALIAALFGTAASFSRLGSLASALKMSVWHLAFLPQTLACVAAFMIAMVTVEELVFRGYLQHALEARLASLRLANVVQALVFAAYHIPRDVVGGLSTPRVAVDLVCMFVFGILFGTLRSRYRNLGGPWVVHLAFNIPRTYFVYAVSIGLTQSVTSALDKLLK